MKKQLTTRRECLEALLQGHEIIDAVNGRIKFENDMLLFLTDDNEWVNCYFQTIKLPCTIAEPPKPIIKMWRRVEFVWDDIVSITNCYYTDNHRHLGQHEKFGKGILVQSGKVIGEEE